MKHGPRPKRQRGIALITALLMTVIFLALIGALMAQMIGELQDVGAHSNSAKALDAAYAGVENMVLEIEENASGPGHVAPSPITYSYPSSTVSYSASATTTWNSSSGLVYYLITSTGTEGNSGQTRTVNALVRSFPYSYYEQFTAGNSGNVYYVTGERFDGPVYNGGTMNIWYQDPSAQPIFANSVMTVTNPSWYEGAGKTSVSQANVKWNDVMAGGSSSNFKIGTNPMQLPTFQNNLSVSSEAYYGDATHNGALPTPGGNGLYINGGPALSGSGQLKTGLYIQGNVKITPTSPGTNNEVFTIAPLGSPTIPASYTVTVDFTNNRTTVAQTTGCPCSSVTYTGTLSGQPKAGVTAGNGAIFVDGNVDLYSGTIHGDYSITVPDYTTDHGHIIQLRGNAPGILYKDQSSTSSDELGIWANDITVRATTSTGYEFDGSILTGYYGECPPCTDGTFSDANYNGSVEGTFTFYGGLIQNINGAMGISSGGSLVHGFSRNYKYDARLAANPPPGFPITNRYDIVAWLDEGR